MEASICSIAILSRPPLTESNTKDFSFTLQLVVKYCATVDSIDVKIGPSADRDDEKRCCNLDGFTHLFTLLVKLNTNIIRVDMLTDFRIMCIESCECKPKPTTNTDRKLP